MPKPLKEWLGSPEITKLRNLDDQQNKEELLSDEFFRDPMRHVHYDQNYFYSFADGIVLYAFPKVDPAKTMLEIKGKDFTLREMLNDEEYNKSSLVIGVFMTTYDVHINRIPTDGYFADERSTPFIYTHNLSMMLAEKDLLQDLKLNKDNLNYLFCNEKRIVTIFCPAIHGRYYLVQIADKNVDVITNWGKGHLVRQGDRYGEIRWGSQVDLIIPLTHDTKFEILVKPMEHVQAGIDPILKILK